MICVSDGTRSVPTTLEGNLVFSWRRWSGGSGTALSGGTGRRTWWRLAVIATACVVEILVLRAAATASTATAAAEHLHSLADDFEFGALLAVRFPLVELEPALNEHRRALAQIFAGHFRRPPPKRDIDKGDFLHPLAGLILAAIVDGQSDFRNCHPALQILHLEIAGDVAHRNDAVKAGHEAPQYSAVRSAHRLVNKRFCQTITTLSE